MEEQVGILRSYMEKHHLFRPENKEHPLFYNSRREKLTRSGVTFILHTYAQMARNLHPEFIPDKISCHSLRHSKSMHLLQNGVNLVYIRDILGHSSIQTTDIYAVRIVSKNGRLLKMHNQYQSRKQQDKLWKRIRHFRMASRAEIKYAYVKLNSKEVVVIIWKSMMLAGRLYISVALHKKTYAKLYITFSNGLSNT
jgi:hypothetical protein